jgi:hypothetical protein
MPSKLPPDPPKGLPSIVNYGTVEQHVHYNDGQNAQSVSTSSRTDSTTSVTSQSFYTKHLSKHGPAYWLIHLFVALLATALFEFGLWLYHH